LGEGVTADLDEELDEAAQQEREKLRAQFRPEDLAQYAIKGKAHTRGGGGGTGGEGGEVEWEGSFQTRLDGSTVILVGLYSELNALFGATA